MKKALILAVVLLGVQTIHAQIVVFAGQGPSRQKVGYYENETIVAVDKQDQITFKGMMKAGKNGRLEICASNGSPMGYLELNDNPLGASTVYNNNGKKLGFVSFSDGLPVVHSFQNGMPVFIGSAEWASAQNPSPNHSLAAATAAFLLLFDWC